MVLGQLKRMVIESKRRINSPDLYLFHIEVLFLWENICIAEGLGAASAALIEVVFNPNSVLKAHPDSDATFLLAIDESLILARPSIHFRNLLITVSKDEHLTSATFACLDSLNQKSPKLVAFVFFYNKYCWLDSFGLIEKSGERSAVFDGAVDLDPIIESV